MSDHWWSRWIYWRRKWKYLVFDSTDESKEVLQKYTELWDGIKNKIETINGGIEREYGRDFMKTKFKTDDNLPSNKLSRLCMLKIIIRSAFEEDGKFNPQVYLDGCLHKLWKWYSLMKLKISERIVINKTSTSK